MRYYEITITVDVNDANYVSMSSKITQEELDIIMPLITAIKNFVPYETPSEYKWKYTHNHNYATGECLREDMGEKSPQEYYDFPEEVFEYFEDICPSEEYGFHTVESITLCRWQQKKVLL